MPEGSELLAVPTGKAVVGAPVVVVVGASVVVVVDAGGFVVVVAGGAVVVEAGGFVVVVVGRVVVVTGGAVVVVVKMGIVVVVEKNGNVVVVVVVVDVVRPGWWPMRNAGDVKDLDSSVEEKGRLVTFEVSTNGEGVDGRGALDSFFVDTLDASNAEIGFDAVPSAPAVDEVISVVPGVALFSAAEASNATTPRSTVDATRSVNNCEIRLDDVPLENPKFDNLPMHQILQSSSKIQPLRNQLQPNLLPLIRAALRQSKPSLGCARSANERKSRGREC
jgi:hypothetical protein